MELNVLSKLALQTMSLLWSSSFMHNPTNHTNKHTQGGSNENALFDHYTQNAMRAVMLAEVAGRVIQMPVEY